MHMYLFKNRAYSLSLKSTSLGCFVPLHLGMPSLSFRCKLGKQECESLKHVLAVPALRMLTWADRKVEQAFASQLLQLRSASPRHDKHLHQGSDSTSIPDKLPILLILGKIPAICMVLCLSFRRSSREFQQNKVDLNKQASSRLVSRDKGSLLLIC